MNSIEQLTEVVSILLPTYNRATYIDDAIRSVIDQTFQKWKLIIINDYSQDATVQKIEAWPAIDSRISVLHNKQHHGIQKSLNIGLIHAKGEYIARIDDDDRWLPHKLQMQVDFLEANKQYVLVGTGALVCDEHFVHIARYSLPLTDSEMRAKLLRKNCFLHSSVLFRRECAIACGGYNESEQTLYVEDYDLWLAMGMRGKLANLGINGIHYMLHSNTIGSIHKITQLINNIYLIKKYRHTYPFYRYSLVMGYVRLYVYLLFRSLPFLKKFQGKLVQYYKKAW